MDNVSISGAGSITGGEYGKITFSGSSRINGSVRCTALSASGSVQAKGDIDCTGKVQFSGSSKCEGSLTAEVLSASGSSKIDGDVLAKQFRSSGSFSAGRNLRGNTISASGALTCHGDAEAETVKLSGKIRIDGLLNAEHVELQPSAGSNIGSIGGTVISVKRLECFQLGDILSSVQGFLQSIGITTADTTGLCLHVDVIEGDEVELDVTEANTVRGRTVVLHANTSVGRVEYSEDLRIEDGAQIGEIVQIS